MPISPRIPDGSALGLGGVFLHRGPFALLRELARQQRRNLEIIKPSPGYDLDFVCRSQAVAKVRTGFRVEAGHAAPTAPITARECEARASLDPLGEFAAEAPA